MTSRPPRDVNDLAYWYPKLTGTEGLALPSTEIVHTDVGLFDLLDGKRPEGYDAFIGDLLSAAERICPIGTADGRLGPVFLRTGHGSGKHTWSRTCMVRDRKRIGEHVSALVEWSALCDLPVNTWVVRELLPVRPLFTCEVYCDLPLVREFRLFVEGGDVTHTQPYWPPQAVAEGRPDTASWTTLLHEASQLANHEALTLEDMALRAVAAIGHGDWSVDFLQTVDGHWYLIDMADAARSYRYDVR